MWHEARRQERKIRGLLVDYKKRADRRREFYEKIKLDPTQFLRVYGRPYKINFDPAVAMAAESPQSMMPWQGDTANMIDRFDVRAHLDLIPDAPVSTKIQLSREDQDEESQCNYERYRTLVENDASGLTEEQCLNEIYIDEHFGVTVKGDEEKQKNADKKAAIGYTYEDSTPADPVEEQDEVEEEDEDDSDDDSIDTDVETADLDVTLDVDLLTPEQEVEINSYANQYGMKDQDFVRLLRRDKAEIEALKYARQIEEEKAQFSGRKSRRERRAFKEKQLMGRHLSPPSYAARSSPKYEPYKRAGSSSRSRSRSPEDVGQVKFITSFGAESEEEGAVHGPALPPPSATASAKSDRSAPNDSHSDKNRPQSWKTRARPTNLRPKSTRSRSRSPRPLRRSSDRSSRHYHDRRSRSRSRSRRRQDSRDRERPGRYRDSRDRPDPRDRYDPRDRGDYRHRYDSRDVRDRFNSRESRDQPRLGRYDRERVASSSWGRPRRDSNRSRSRSEGHRRSRSRSRPTRSRSKSASRSSSSRSKSVSRSRSRSKSGASPSKSKSDSQERSSSPKPVEIKRYRRDSLSSHSSVSGEDDDNDTASKTSTNETAADSASRNKSGTSSSVLGNTGGDFQGKLTPRERLKRKMQAQLNRQYKADKKAEISRISKMEQERMDREEELRLRTMEMRRREREKRHREMEALERERKLRRGAHSDVSSDDDDDEGKAGAHNPRHARNNSNSDSPEYGEKSRSASRSRSRSTSSERVGLVNY